MVYKDFKDLARRTASDKVFCKKNLFNIAKIQIMVNISVYLLLFFDKKYAGTSIYTETGINSVITLLTVIKIASLTELFCN